MTDVPVHADSDGDRRTDVVPVLTGERADVVALYAAASGQAGTRPLITCSTSAILP